MTESRIRQVLLVVSIAFTAAFAVRCGSAQDPSDDGHQHAPASLASHEHAKESLAFRLPNWKQMHFDDQKKAQQHLETVTKLGCEAQQKSHSGHTDVSYRCPEWKSITVENHDLAHQWEGWLKASGFDVSHGHVDATFASGPETVAFRLLEWKSIHGNGSADEQKLIETLKKVGCDVRVDAHNGHSDIRFRAPIWRDIHLSDHAGATQWLEWFKANGFEAKHGH